MKDRRRETENIVSPAKNMSNSLKSPAQKKEKTKSVNNVSKAIFVDRTNILAATNINLNKKCKSIFKFMNGFTGLACCIYTYV